ncbi:MAG TPA: hypothetical protein VFC86_06155, partial [Planctomycetota bacterium]|nr:hypothetical protein [Planctomycetota bacterium]
MFRLPALAALLVAVSCVSAPSPNQPSPGGLEDSIATRVRELHEGDLEIREAAMVALAALGPDALPAIRGVQRRIVDQEVSVRLQSVIERLEEQDGLVRLVGRPRLVDLSVRRAPIHEVLKELTRQSAVRVEGEDL